MQVEAAGQENAYVDTSSYEQLYKLYEDYFKLGIACQATVSYTHLTLPTIA